MTRIRMLLLACVLALTLGLPANAVSASAEGGAEQTVSSDVTAVLSAKTYKTTGVVRTPSVTVKDGSGNVLKEGTDYTVAYDNGRIKPGKYHVKVTLQGDYSGSRTMSFIIKANTGKAKQSGKWLYKNKKTKGKTVRVKKGYQFKDGSYPVGATKIGKKYYYFKGTKGKLDTSTKQHHLRTSDGLTFDVASDGTLQKGWQVVDGKLYYFGGTYRSAVVKKKVDGIKLTEDGTAKESLNANVKTEAIKLLDSITDRTASKKTQLRAVYRYMTTGGHFRYMTKNPDVSDKRWVRKSAYDMLRTHSGSCSGFAAMFTAMAQEIGYKDAYLYYGRVHGSRDHAADGFTRHAITVIDGYYYDTEGDFAGWLSNGWKIRPGNYITFIQKKKYRY